jgi:hypothetical protein
MVRDDDEIGMAEADLVERFREYYASSESEAIRELERRTLGVAFGGNGYTDTVQVQRFVSLLGVSRGDRLLELGSGAGWPGLYIAQQSGAEVVLSDVPWEGLVRGQYRGRHERISTDAVACLGTELPFRDMSFAGVTHSDVMC